MLERLFRLDENRTTVRIEIVAGATTYLTMAYIVFVNPLILANAGMDRGAVFVATCLASAFATLLMALLANYPLALAPGMGMNAYFTYSVVKGLHYSWEVALGAVFLSGVLFLILSLTRIRSWIVDAIPLSQKMAISAGIGLFLGIIALKEAGIIAASPDTLVTLGDLKSPATLLAAAGFIVMVALDRLAVPGAIIIAILGTAIAGILLGISPFAGIVDTPPSLAPTFLALDLHGALDIGIATVVFVFLFVDLFDNTGTLVGVAHRAGLLGPDGKLPRIGRVFIADSIAAMAGALLGTSTVTSYIESAAGVKAGGRTGLTGVTVAGARLCRARLGRRHRIRPGGGDRAGDAADLFDRQRHRFRFHHLRRGQAAVRALCRGRPVDAGARRAVCRQICVLLSRGPGQSRRRSPSPPHGGCGLSAACIAAVG